MRLRFCGVTIGLLVLSFVASLGGSIAMAQQGNGSQDSISNPPMSTASGFQQSLDRRIVLLHLEIFEGILPSCGDDCPAFVTTQVSWVKAWSCITKACGIGGDNRSIDCLKNFTGPIDLSKKESGDKLICDMVKSPGIETRQALIKAFSPPTSKGDGFVEGLAYVYALEGNVAACQDEIKNFVGPYGPAWSAHWFQDMSGCRILAKARTHQEEEKDFSSWLRGNCSNIVNTEMRNACNTPGTIFPDVTVPTGK